MSHLRVLQICAAVLEQCANVDPPRIAQLTENMFVRLPAEGPGVKDVRKRCSNIFGGLASLLIIGDWVMAISHAPMPIGYRQTLFTSHAPTILREIVKFDKELDTALKLGGIPPVESRAAGKQCPMKRWARW